MVIFTEDIIQIYLLDFKDNGLRKTKLWLV